jgi:methionyl-tRNA formyltransferase
VRFAFAGTPEFGARVLRGLAELSRAPVLVISQPDRPRGRGRRACAPFAAVEAGCLGLECVQSDDINSRDVIERLQAAHVSTLVVAAFGQMLGKPLLDGLLCLNVHAALLPAYRGAAPIQRALANGESRTGVTIMRITEKLDEGPWALQKAVSLDLHDDAGSVESTLALLGATGIDQVLTGLADGTVTWKEQVGPSSYAKKLTVKDTLLDANRSARAAHDQVRSLSPGVGARAASGQLSFKVWRTWPYGEDGLDPVPGGADHVAGSAGSIAVFGERLFVGCSRGALELLAVQPAGKRTMTAAEFLRGYGRRLDGRLETQAVLEDDEAAGFAESREE